jgi:L-malate glycosyltransferase
MDADSNKINVALIDLGKGFRGGQRQTLNLALALRLEKIPVCVICDPKSNFSERCKQSDLETYGARYNTLSLGGMARKIVKFLRLRKTTIIHASESHGHTLGILAKLFHSDLKLIVSSRTCFEKTSFLSRRFKYSTPKVNRFVAISNAVASNLLIKGVPKTNIEIIYSAIDRDYFNPDNRTKNDTFTIGTACALEPGKGVNQILVALGGIKEKLGDFKFKIAGTGPKRDFYEQLAKKNSLRNIVEFTGFVDDMSEFYRSLDVYILASKSEGLGSSLLEAAACGAVPIGTKTGGIVEVIEDGVDGFLHEYGNTEHLSEILLKLQYDREICNKMIKEFEKKLESFDIKHIVNKYITLYHKILAG